MPNQTIVNRDAVGGNQATRDNSPVEAATISTVSFTDSCTARVKSLML